MSVSTANALARGTGRPWALSHALAAFGVLYGSTWLSAVLQLGIDASGDNLVCVAFVVLSATLTFLYIQRSQAMREVPLSTVAVLGLCMTTQWGALVGQSVLGDSLTANLRVPLQTFGYLLGFQLVAISAHWVSRRLAAFMAMRRVGADLLAPLGVFQVPSVAAMWAIGLFGLAATLVGKGGDAGLMGKIADGFSVFIWAPFVIPLLAVRYGRDYCALRRQLPALAAFAAVVMLVGLALNARAFMLTGVLTAVLLFALFVLDDDRPLRLRQVRWVAMAVLAGALLFQPLSYFFTAMQVARAERDKLSRLELVKHTIAVLQDPAAIRRESNRMLMDADVGAYDEIYFRTSMIGRLVETKFHDNGFYMVQGSSPLESRLVGEDAWDRVLSILPFPVLKWMDLERAKYVSLYSAGDMLANLRLGLELGSFRTGSMFAQGIAIWGVWAPFLYFLLCIPVFIAWDMLSRSARGGAVGVISLIGLVLIYRLFAYGIVAESVSNLLGSLLRFQAQTILFYSLVFALTRLVWKPFDPAPISGKSGTP